MSVTWRSLNHSEVDHELLWVSISIGGLFCATTWFALGLPWPVCWFHEITGRPCATCGATRAAIAFFHGHVLAAFQWNPLASAAYCGIAFFDAYAVTVLLTGGRRFRASFTDTEKKFARISAVTLLALNWAYLVAHSRMFAV
jgi:Protein of unknown function (DUF2752)